MGKQGTTEFKLWELVYFLVEPLHNSDCYAF